MNLDHQEKCHLTFPTDKGTAHLLTQIAHLQGMTQPQLLHQICQAYVKEKAIDLLTKIPPNLLDEALNNINK